MYANQLIVLKFGGSVLHGQDDQFLAAQEIYRWYRAGYRVIAIVSALQGRTDQLWQQANAIGPNVDAHNVARLVSVGERESAALLGLTLDECGIPNQVMFEGEIDLQTCGNPLDATPVSIDRDAIEQALHDFPVLVIPGFVGQDRAGRVNLLGRGGSDLTAIFIAHSASGDRCRLIKDVDGLYEFDPNSSHPRPPRRFTSIHWQEALKLDDAILQHKAIQYALDHRVNFEVATRLANQSTRVGSCQRRFAPTTEVREREQPLRVGLLGFGAVGRGVFDQLQRQSGHFEIVKIAVRQLEKHPDALLHPRLFTDDWRQVVHSDCDVVVELMGGVHAAREAVNTALSLGKHVITANKSLLAQAGAEIEQQRRAFGARLLFSAAVGGGVPMLEAVHWIGQRYTVRQLEGVLNGTTNFVLDQLTRGEVLDQAIDTAQKMGLAEADPWGDLNGNDAAEKLVLLARAAGRKIALGDVDTRDLKSSLSDESVNNSRSLVYRQVATLESPETENAQVATIAVPADSPLAANRQQNNLLLIRTEEGREWSIRGAGAGRWPTTMAAVADLLSLAASDLDAIDLVGPSPVGVKAHDDSVPGYMDKNYSKAGCAIRHD